MELLIPALIVVWLLLAALMFGLRLLPYASDGQQSTNSASGAAATDASPSHPASLTGSGEHARPDAW